MGELKNTNADVKQVLDFWFDPNNKPYWFLKNEEFDQKIREDFFKLWQQACQGELFDWRINMEGRLAEIILLDQFSRNLYRDSELAFKQDGMALVLAQEALRQAEYGMFNREYQKFILMPFMHSESVIIHNKALAYFEQLDDPLTLDYEIRHKAIVERFGRYPHRNEILNRESRAEEIEFLKGPDSHF